MNPTRVVVTLFLLASLCAGFMFPQGVTSETVESRFRLTALPYTDGQRVAAGKQPLRYSKPNENHSVNRKGEIPDSLNCSTFASPVLHKFADGDWATFDTKIQEKWPDEIAAAYKLTGAITASVEYHLNAYRSKSLKPGVFFFDLRTETALGPVAGRKANGGLGHTGFLIVEGTGVRQAVEQVHMSGTEAATGTVGGGLAYNDRWEQFLTSSAYGRGKAAKTSQIVLYPLRLPPQTPEVPSGFRIAP